MRVALPVLALFVLAAGCAGHSHEPAVATATATCASVLAAHAPVTPRAERVATSDSVTVDAANAAFDPTCVTNVGRGTFALTVRNTGLVIHDVAIPAQHVDVDIRPGRSVTIRVRIDTQPVVYVCRYHRALGMVGVLIPAR